MNPFTCMQPATCVASLIAAWVLFLSAPTPAQAQYGYGTGSRGYGSSSGELGPRAARTARAFQGPRISRPTVSPYLNLIGGRGRPIVEYYGIVRPALDFYNPVVQDRIRLERDATRSSEEGKNQEDAPVRTGRRGFFSNYGHYYR